LLKSLIHQLFRAPAEAETPQKAFPLDELRVLKERHEKAPLDLHTRILFGDSLIAGNNLLETYESCMRATATAVSPWKTLIRIQAAANLARYFLHTLRLEGARAECGVFQGFSALFACRAASQINASFDGADFHLIDSFAGFPQLAAQDYIPMKAEGRTRVAPAFRKGDAAVSFEQVQTLFQSFPRVHLKRGFIPEILCQLPETGWAFVHIDVDLYEATLAALEYFYPRLVKGGVIICDDYGSRLFPGARKAWDSYSEANNIPFITLETGQSVIIC
jgi:O-methyltransferase